MSPFNSNGIALPAVEQLIQTVHRFTDPIWIGLYGSAAGDGTRFGENSDIDLLVIHKSESRYFMTELEQRPVEISQYSTLKVQQIYTKPQWFGLNWLMEVGKFETAESLYGQKPRVEIRALHHLIGIISAIGIIWKQRDESNLRGEGRRVDNGNRQAVRTLQQLATLDFSGPKVSLPPKSLEEVLVMIDGQKQTMSPVLIENLNRILFYPIHWTGVRVLVERWNLDLKLPQVGTLH